MLDKILKYNLYFFLIYRKYGIAFTVSLERILERLLAEDTWKLFDNLKNP